MNAKEMAKGHWRTILAHFGIDDKLLDGKHHECPSTGEGKDRFRFSNNNGSGSYFCSCSDGGNDGFDLLKCCKGMEFKDVAREIETFFGKAQPKPDAVRPKKDPAVCRRDLLRVRGEMTKDADEMLAYLRSRRIDWHPNNVFQVRTNYGLRPIGITEPMTAMASLLKAPNGQNVSLHLTFLEDGKKATHERTRIVMSPVMSMHGAAVRLAPVSKEGVLGVGEGIESSLSAAAIYNIPVWATLNANGMSGFEPPEGIPIKKLVIFIDRDDHYVGQAAGYSLARRLAGKKDRPEEIVVAWPALKDFNDDLQVVDGDVSMIGGEIYGS